MSDEASRLRELQRLMVMDSPEETAYNDLVRLAAGMAGTPMALISLVDDTRQWFKARVGVQVRETPREHAFCAHAIQNPSQPLIVNDTWADPRFSSNVLVTGEPNIRFYAGAPLVTSSGRALGTVCVLDTRPRQLTAEQVEQLKFMAQQVVSMLEQKALPVTGSGAA